MESLVIDCETGEIIRKPLSQEEIQAFESQAKSERERLEAGKARYDATVAKFKALGFTEDDLKALGL